jgi:carboxyl-terminal processing protease
MKRINFLSSITFFILTGLLVSCGEKDDPVVENITNTTTQRINQFIFDAMDDVYLWYNYMPDIDPLKETDSKAYFEKLLYVDDKWSFITDDVSKWENSLNGVEKSFGYSLAFGAFVDENDHETGKYFAIVEYTYPNTPADRAGFKRGDIITKIDGSSITEDNYMGLFDSESATLTKAELTVNGISDRESVKIISDTLSLDPVVIYKIIKVDNHKIGYLFYTQYITDYNSSLQTAFEYFKSNQITDLVLDLRYNPGGYQAAAQYLCSSIAPISTVNGQSVLVSLQWNDKWQEHWESEGITEQITVPFDKSVPVKLGLNKLTVLTGSGTASSSELTITGLKAYMDVVLVGDTTYGKYTGSFTIKPEDIYAKKSEYSDFENWGMQPIVMRYANAQGVTNFVNGFPPDYLVKDELLPASPLGDLSEPLLKKAVENITNVPILAIKSAQTRFKFKVIDRGYSKFDRLKRNSVIFSKSDFTKKQENSY